MRTPNNHNGDPSINGNGYTYAVRGARDVVIGVSNYDEVRDEIRRRCPRYEETFYARIQIEIASRLDRPVTPDVRKNLASMYHRAIDDSGGD